LYGGFVAIKRKRSWHGVRTLFRLVAAGKPKTLDKHFDPTSTLLEDRIVLFQADSFDSAIQQAEADAQAYSKATQFKNIYGQSVRLKFLGASDAFCMVDHELSSGCEVYSSTAIVPRSVSNARLITERFGKAEKCGEPARYKFIDGKIRTEAFARSATLHPKAPKVSRR
jgi:hypothetical protein